ncbi:NHLP leader peptide family RiPP precursor [Paenibacillus sp. NFR01]|uniref:NHLP leader peptide family RiPP precursor n=1 Tax=Paenibacillus sp. NFR01 TaxID=1566279 RepID=UPI000B86675C|nr:NHLP leader peptide family RiPP precursor [Paenibacillus sp. NFR01]
MSTAILTNQVIQKAWEDPSFKSRLLANPKAAIREVLGIDFPDNITLKAVEEGASEFYLVIPPSPSSGVMSIKEKEKALGSW